MRIACLVAVCVLLLTITLTDGESRLGASSIDDVIVDSTSSSKSSWPSSTPPEDEACSDVENGQNRQSESFRVARRAPTRRLGDHEGLNDLDGPTAAEMFEESAEIHIEPIHRLTKKSTMESIVDLIRRAVGASDELGPLIGPVRFPGLGEKVFIRLPEPVEYESNHVVVRLVQRPDHDQLQDSSPQIHQADRRRYGTRQDGQTMPSKNLKVNQKRPHRQDPTRPSASGGPHQDPVGSYSSAYRNPRDDLDQTARMSKVRGLGDRTRNGHSFQRNNAGYEVRRYLNKGNQQWNVRPHANYRPPWPQPTRSGQLTSRSYPGAGKNDPRNRRNPGNPGYYGPSPKRRPNFSTGPKYSSMDLKTDSNEWRGIAVNYPRNSWPRRGNQRLPYPAQKDLRYSRTSPSRYQIPPVQWQTNWRNFSGGFDNDRPSAFRVVSPPALQKLRPTVESTIDFVNTLRNVSNESNDVTPNVTMVAKESSQVLNHEWPKNSSRFQIFVLPTNTDRLIIKPQSKASRNLRDSYQLGRQFRLDRSEDASKFESLERVLRFDDVNSVSKVTNTSNGSEELSAFLEIENEDDESDELISRETKSLKDSDVPSTERSQSETSKTEDTDDYQISSTVRTKAPGKSKTNPTKYPKTGKNDVLFNIMSMTASQSWNQQPANSKAKSVVGILNIRSGGRNVVAKIPETLEKPENHRLMDYESSNEYEPVDETTEDYFEKSVDNRRCDSDISDDDTFDRNCEYDMDSLADSSEAS